MAASSGGICTKESDAGAMICNTSLEMIRSIELGVKTALEADSSRAAGGRKRARDANDEPQGEVKRCHSVMTRRLQSPEELTHQMDTFVSMVRYVRTSRQAAVADQETRASSPSLNSVCAICLDDISNHAPMDQREATTALACGHVYHRECIDRWSEYNRCCPIDRRPIDAQEDPFFLQ